MELGLGLRVSSSFSKAEAKKSKKCMKKNHGEVKPGEISRDGEVWLWEGLEDFLGSNI